MKSVQEKDNEILPVIVTRRLTISGGSLMVAIPKVWLEQHCLEKGDEVLVVVNGSLEIIPKNKEVMRKMQKVAEEISLLTQRRRIIV